MTVQPPMRHLRETGQYCISHCPAGQTCDLAYYCRSRFANIFAWELRVGPAQKPDRTARTAQHVHRQPVLHLATYGLSIFPRNATCIQRSCMTKLQAGPDIGGSGFSSAGGSNEGVGGRIGGMGGGVAVAVGRGRVCVCVCPAPLWFVSWFVTSYACVQSEIWHSGWAQWYIDRVYIG